MSETNERQELNHQNILTALYATRDELGWDWKAPVVKHYFDPMGRPALDLDEGTLASFAYFDPTTEDDTCGCVWGHVLQRMGYGPSDVREGKGMNWVLTGIWFGMQVGMARLTPEQRVLVDAADAAQNANDRGEPLAVIVREFEKVLEKAALES